LRPHFVHLFHFSVCQTPARARTTPPATGPARPKDPRPSLPRYQSLDTRPGPARQQAVGRRTGPDRQPCVGPQGGQLEAGPARQNQLDTRPRLASVRRQRISVDLEALDSPVSTDSRSSSMVRFFGLCKMYFFCTKRKLQYKTPRCFFYLLYRRCLKGWFHAVLRIRIRDLVPF